MFLFDDPLQHQMFLISMIVIISFIVQFILCWDWCYSGCFLWSEFILYLQHRWTNFCVQNIGYTTAFKAVSLNFDKFVLNVHHGSKTSCLHILCIELLYLKFKKIWKTLIWHSMSSVSSKSSIYIQVTPLWFAINILFYCYKL